MYAGDFPSKRKDAKTLMDAAADTLMTREDYPEGANLFWRQQEAESLEKQLEEDPESVMDRIEELRARLVRPENVAVHLAADADLVWSTYGEDFIAMWRDKCVCRIDEICSAPRSRRSRHQALRLGRVPAAGGGGPLGAARH